MSDKFEITYKENGVSIKTFEMLYDANGNPKGYDKGHRIALGIGDAPTPEAFQAKVRANMETVYGAELADLISENATHKAEVEDLRAYKAQALTQIADLSKLATELETERDILRATEISNKTKIAELEAAESAAITSLDSLTIERDQLEAVKLALQEEKVALEEENSLLKAKEAQSAARIVELEEQVNKFAPSAPVPPVNKEI